MKLFRKKNIHTMTDMETPLSRCLSTFDLTFLGIGAIIGAGIFVLTGIVAATQTGPAIVFSYIMAGLACTFAALSYAELAASIGGCGSAYGYAYAGFGEIIAWIVGWDLLLEYSVSVAAVSVGWSSYFNDLLLSLHIHVPIYLLHGPLDAHAGFMNILGMGVIFFLALLLIIGVMSSSRVNNIMVLIKLAVIGLFIIIASMEVDTNNWTPFFPYGWNGVMEGAALIFFAYVGFDAVSTAAEEAIDPQRSMPIGIIVSLLVCTVIYIIVSGLLTGIIPYPKLDVASPISHTLLILGYKFAAGAVGVGAVAGLTTVMLVLFYGLSRIFFAMSRDGLLPKYFAITNSKTKTPVRIIVVCGLIMAIASAFIPLGDLAELVNVGTLFAFIIVCTGVIILRYKNPDLPRPFTTPLMPLLPILGIISCSYLIINLPWITILRFILWMVVGIGVYFSFSRINSALYITGEGQS
jgi:APA family basic amino acid/polyamine antiporter